jgi:hypothetical protein
VKASSSAVASFLPFTNKQHELGSHVSYLHVEGEDGFMIEGNYSYNFRSRDVAFTPDATAGINISHFGVESNCDELEDTLMWTSIAAALITGLQVGGGLKRRLRRFDVFGESRVLTISTTRSRTSPLF